MFRNLLWKCRRRKQNTLNLPIDRVVKTEAATMKQNRIEFILPATLGLKNGAKLRITILLFWNEIHFFS